MNNEDRFLASDHALVRSLAFPDERMLAPLDVLDWWQHPGEEGRTSPTGLVGVPRKLVVTTRRLLVVLNGTIERSVDVTSIGGAELLGPSEFPLDETERAVLVRSGGDAPTVWGCWSTATNDAHRLMNDIFSMAHGVSGEMG